MAGNHMSELSPRQRMINMMYLVLTALLALNVSKQVLDAFQKMDGSIGYSYSEKVDFNQKAYSDFQLKALNNPEKLGAWNEIALNVKSESEALIAVIDSVRFKIEELSGRDSDGMLIEKSNKELTTTILVKNKDKKGYGYGEKLRIARERYRDFLLSLDSLDIFEGPDSVYKLNITTLLNSDAWEDPDGPKGTMSWEEKQYYGHVPVAAMAFMNQMKLDVGNMEGAVLELLQKKTGQSAITVNKQIGVVKAPRQSIMLGDSFHARVFIAGVDTNQLPQFKLYQYNSDGQRIGDTVLDSLEVEGSQGIFAIKPNKQGTYWLGGDILVQSEEGEKVYEFTQQYRVDAAMSVISPDAMNVLYTVVDNPVSIAVPGYSSEELTLHSNIGNACKIKRIKNGTYQINIAEQRGKNRKKEVKLTVKANNKIVGKPISFRVKNVPEPYPKLGNIVGYGEMSKADLGVAWGLTAKLDNFEFDLRYKIVSFTMSYPGAGGQQDLKVTGGQFPANVKKEFGSIKRGQTIIFRDIKYQIAGVKGQKPKSMKGTVSVKVK
tara:strand:+ start:2912 stop:4552 length:1641 start_codon:yes stop_codon:yes gene_type:complete